MHIQRHTQRGVWGSAPTKRLCTYSVTPKGGCGGVPPQSAYAHTASHPKGGVGECPHKDKVLAFYYQYFLVFFMQILNNVRGYMARVEKLYVFLLLFFVNFSPALAAEVYQDFNLYTKLNGTVTHSNTSIATQHENKEHKATVFGGNFDGYFMYSLFYNAFYLSFAPQFKMRRSQPSVLLKEFLLSYSFNAFEISLGKTKENRYLTSSKDYLTVPGRLVPFNDEFSFWKLSMYMPLEYVSFELGSKLIRENYKFEWKGFDKARSKNYLYVDFDYGGFSSHVGYAYTYDIFKKNHAHDISAKVLYNYEDIIGGYFANLIAFEQDKGFSLNNYSYTVGVDFSFANAFGKSATNFDVKLNAELMYEKDKYSIAAPRLTFYYDELSLFNVFTYTFGEKSMSNTSAIAYTIGAVTFRVFNKFSYLITKTEHYEQKGMINTFGLEVVYEL